MPSPGLSLKFVWIEYAFASPATASGVIDAAPSSPSSGSPNASQYETAPLDLDTATHRRPDRTVTRHSNCTRTLWAPASTSAPLVMGRTRAPPPGAAGDGAAAGPSGVPASARL